MPTDDGNSINAVVGVNSVTSEAGGVCLPVNAQPVVAGTIRKQAYDIIRKIAQDAGTGVTIAEVLGPSRVRHIVDVRFLAIVEILRRFPWMSYPQVGRLMGGRDHSSIMNAVRRMGAWEPRRVGGGGGALGVLARTYGPHIDFLFVRLGAALSAQSTTNEGETNHETA